MQQIKVLIYAYQKILNPTGMDGLYVYNGYGNIF